MQNSQTLQSWLKEKHSQKIYRCSICGRLHEAHMDSKRYESFILFVGGFLDGVTEPSEKKMRPTLDGTEEPNLFCVCKRLSCMVRFVFKIITISKSTED